MKIWKTGDTVLITYGGKSVPGRVVLASPNGVSLTLQFDAMLGGFVGAMPVLFDTGAGEFLDLFAHQPVKLIAIHYVSPTDVAKKLGVERSRLILEPITVRGSRITIVATIDGKDLTKDQQRTVIEFLDETGFFDTHFVEPLKGVH